MANIWTLEYFIEQSKKIHGEDAFDYSEVKYINQKTKVILTCKNGHKREQTPYSNVYEKYGCYCCNSTKKTQEQFIQQSKTQFPEMFEYDKVNYKTDYDKVILYCNKHKKYFDILPNTHFRKRVKYVHGGCPECIKEYANKSSISTDQFIEKAKQIHGEDKYDYSLVNYKNSYTKIKIRCIKHDNIFEMSPYQHIHKKHGCRLCNNSIGENYITLFLKKYNIKFEPEKTFKKCKYKNFLRFDFCVFDDKDEVLFLIEYNGRQHYEGVNFSGKMTKDETQQELEILQLKDEIKRKFCEDNRIDLLRIPYTEFKNIDQILFEKFKNHGINLENSPT